jgi:hypothetical protein
MALFFRIQIQYKLPVALFPTLTIYDQNYLIGCSACHQYDEMDIKGMPIYDGLILLVSSIRADKESIDGF